MPNFTACETVEVNETLEKSARSLPIGLQPELS